MTAGTGTPGLGVQPAVVVDLEAVRALIDAATRGPWREWPVDPIPLRQVGPSEAGPVALVYERSERPADAAFIAAARTLVPQMAAEVAELRDQLAVEDRAGGDTIDQRDDATEWADRLADAVAILTGRDMGEHSNMNNPWKNAVEALVEYARQAGEVR